MHHFQYRDGALFAEEVDLRDIVGAVGSPVYVYSSATITRHYDLFAKAVGATAREPRAHVFYAVKANANLGVLQTLAERGAGADTVSEGEIRKALAAGIPADRIEFSGVGKMARELAFAVERSIYQVNIETEGELELLNRIAVERGKRQTAVLRINPDVGAGGHAKITTGSSDNKFGISFEDAGRLYARAANLAGIRMAGVATHIGSQITETNAFEPAFRRLRGLVEALRGEGHAIERLDFGGGLGIPYDVPHPFSHGPEVIEAYASLIDRITAGLDIERGFEPGRLIVGNAGILVTEALYLNPRPNRTFLVVDAAMNDLVRPAMYDAYHEIWPLKQPAPEARRETYDVVGPICETGDTFATGRSLAAVAPGDLLALMTAGAYGASMSSTYNQRPLVPEVLVRGSAFSLTRPRQTYDDLIGQDRLPVWSA
jgi:diaminopimelate decarboxylase